MEKVLQGFSEELKALLNKKGDISFSGIFGSFATYILSAMACVQDKPLIFVSDSDVDAELLKRELSSFIPQDKLFLLPSWEVSYHDTVAPHVDITADRFVCLNNLVNAKGSYVLVTSINAIYHPTISKQNLKKLIFKIKKGQEFDLDAFIKRLVFSGYKRANMVENKGEFSVRGGVIDVFDVTSDDPARIEFFGDEVDSIRIFDAGTQRSINNLYGLEIYPVDEKKLIEESKDTAFFISDYLQKNSLVIFKEIISQKEYLNKFVEGKDIAEVVGQFKDLRKIYFSFLKNQDVESKVKKDFKINQIDLPRMDWNKLKEFLDEMKKAKIDVFYSCANEMEQERLASVLTKEKINIENIFKGNFKKGFVFQEKNIAILTYGDLFRAHDVPKPRRVSRHNQVPIGRISDLKIDDYIVHINYGIGIFKGVKKMSHEGIERQYLIVEYRDADVLYVPLEQMDLVQKYVGMEKARPKINKLGGRAWEQTKEEAKRKIQDMAAEMLEIQAKRKVLQGYSFSKDVEWQREFEQSFIYEETIDQKNAIIDMKKDMEDARPMDRLICGDVGFGKTEVAIRAAFKAVMDHKQVAILVPTTVLAQQHYNNFRDRMAGFPICIEMLSRFRTKKEQDEVVEALKQGTVDIVIGTHRLLSGDIGFKDLGLLIIDEEQRFGVLHKEKIKRMKNLVDVLTMTATPLPRTLYMSLTGVRDMSSINTPPLNRLPVYTEVSYFDERLIEKSIARELSRDGQVFFLHNRVQSIHDKAEAISKIVPYARVCVAHGQMHEHELEDIMLDFMDKKYDVMVCTTIIESGLDIPNANTIFIDRADCFGLADLYQLRGRVGRSRHRAYAYFLVDKDKPLSREAQERLSAINEFNSLGSGYKIALRDLELRGAGNILGHEQHGSIVNIGFDMYCSLLRKTIKELRGERPEVIPALIDLKIDLAIQDDYIPDFNQRLDIYKRIAQAAHEKDINVILDEIKDRFGKEVPKEVIFLIDLSKIKIIAGMKGIIHISRRNEIFDVISSKGHKIFKMNPDFDKNKDKIFAFLWELVDKL